MFPNAPVLALIFCVLHSCRLCSWRISVGVQRFLIWYDATFHYHHSAATCHLLDLNLKEGLCGSSSSCEVLRSFSHAAARTVSDRQNATEPLPGSGAGRAYRCTLSLRQPTLCGYYAPIAYMPLLSLLERYEVLQNSLSHPFLPPSYACASFFLFLARRVIIDN